MYTLKWRPLKTDWTRQICWTRRQKSSHFVRKVVVIYTNLFCVFFYLNSRSYRDERFPCFRRKFVRITIFCLFSTTTKIIWEIFVFARSWKFYIYRIQKLILKYWIIDTFSINECMKYDLIYKKSTEKMYRSQVFLIFNFSFYLKRRHSRRSMLKTIMT